MARFLSLLLIFTLLGSPASLNVSLPGIATGPQPDPSEYHPAQTAITLAPELPLEVNPDLARRIDSILRRSRNRRALWGVEVYSLDEGKIVYSRNSDKKFLPASTVKVFTTAAALDRLGPHFRFKTRVSYEGTLSEDGTLSGDLVLFGGGDPNLAARMEKNRKLFVYLDAMARKVRQAGIRVIEGSVIGDDSLFPYAPYGKGWTSSDRRRRYGAAISSLSFHDNLLRVIVRPGSKEGKPVRVYFDPLNSLLRAVNLAKTAPAGTKSTLYCYRRPGTRRIIVSGKLSSSRRSWVRHVTVDDPALYTANVFLHRLKRAGIRVKGGSRSRHDNVRPSLPARTLYVHESLPLIDVISHVNKKSQNLYAEILLRTLGAQRRGVGTDRAGLEVVYKFLREAGIPRPMVDLYDGSGLSRDNLITPRAQTLVLKHISSQAYFSLFLESLAVSGKDGTLKRRMRRSAARLRVHGKTGSLKEAVTLGGYVKTRSKKTLAFSILINNYRFSSYTAQRVTDQICALLAGS